MIRKLIYVTLVSASMLGQAQDLSPSVIATGGNYSETGTASLSWTIGETVVETLTNGTTTLTQGFQQGNLSVASLIENTELAKTVKVYPNPVNNTLHIETTQAQLTYRLVNMQGQPLQTGVLKKEAVQLDVSTYPTGSYLLLFNEKEAYTIIKK